MPTRPAATRHHGFGPCTAIVAAWATRPTRGDRACRHPDSACSLRAETRPSRLGAMSPFNAHWIGADTISVAGEIDVSTADQLADLCSTVGPHVGIECSRCEFIDSAALSVLLRLRKRVEREGWRGDADRSVPSGPRRARGGWPVRSVPDRHDGHRRPRPHLTPIRQCTVARNSMTASLKASLRSPATMWPAPPTSANRAWGTSARNSRAPCSLSRSL